MRATHRTLAVLALALAAAAPATALALQTVYLDFDSETGAGEWTYSGPERGAVHGALESLFAPLGVTVTTSVPGSVDYSTLFFNADAIGTSTGVDWRNVAFIDDAYVNAGLGLDFVGAPLSGENIVKASVNLGAHEVLHLLGARHHDAFTPIGTGVSSPGNKTKFDPVFPGPDGAALSGLELNSLTTVLGFSADKLLSMDSFIGPRAALKIRFAAHGARGTEDGGSMLEAPEAITVSTYPVINTLPGALEDDPPAPPFEAMVGAMKGEISDGEGDYYSFGGEAGRIVTIEVMSESLGHRLVEGDLAVALLDESGTLIPYHGDFAFNDDGFEGVDPLLLDIELPYTGTYIVEVFGAPPGTPVEYELLVYSLTEPAPVPLPAPLGLLAAGGALLAMRRRRGDA